MLLVISTMCSYAVIKKNSIACAIALGPAAVGCVGAAATVGASECLLPNLFSFGCLTII